MSRTVSLVIDNNLRGAVTAHVVYRDDTNTLRFATASGGLLVAGKTKDTQAVTIENPLPQQRFTVLVYYGENREHAALYLNRSYDLDTKEVTVKLGRVDGAMLALSIVVAVLLVLVIALAVWVGVRYQGSIVSEDSGNRGKRYGLSAAAMDEL